MGINATTTIKSSDGRDPAVSVVLGLYEAIDAGRATAALDLFTTDAVFEGPDGVRRGAAEIADFLAAREANTERRTVHVYANVDTRQLDDRDVEVRGVMLIHTPDRAGDWQLERLTRVRHVVRTADGTTLIVERRREPLQSPTATEAH